MKELAEAKHLRNLSPTLMHAPPTAGARAHDATFLTVADEKARDLLCLSPRALLPPVRVKSQVGTDYLGISLQQSRNPLKAGDPDVRTKGYYMRILSSRKD